MKIMAKSVTLTNGVEMPAIAYGTWNLSTDVSETIKSAIETGYRSIDTAYSYGNDFYVGKAIKTCGIPRNELFITNKVWNTFRGKDAVVEACKKSLKLMKSDYFDLYLIHWPEPITNKDWKEINSSTWEGMEELYRLGIVRSIGVSNFLPHHIEALVENKASVMPMVNQFEFHPGKFSGETLDFCAENGIVAEGWSPLGSGEVLNSSIIKDLSKKYSCTAAQICLKWVESKNVIPIPRSKDALRMKENLFLPDFEIHPDDIKLLDQIKNIGCSIYIPDVNHPQ